MLLRKPSPETPNARMTSPNTNPGRVPDRPRINVAIIDATYDDRARNKSRCLSSLKRRNAGAPGFKSAEET